MTEWTSILYKLSTLSFTHATDKIAWKWETSGSFTVRSLYEFLNFRGVALIKPTLRWHLHIPYRIRVFMWLVANNRILTKVKLQFKGWSRCTAYQFCREEKDIYHLFLKCHLAQHLWFWMEKSQHHFKNRSSIHDIIDFSYSTQRGTNKFSHYVKCFLLDFVEIKEWIVFSILTTIFFFELSSFSSYPRFIWTWAIKGLCRELILLWMPGDIEAIPLQVWDLEDSQIVLYQEPEERDDFSD